MAIMSVWSVNPWSNGIDAVLRLNSWASAFAIPGVTPASRPAKSQPPAAWADTNFLDARRAASCERFRAGLTAWNEWASAMLALRQRLRDDPTHLQTWKQLA